MALRPLNSIAGFSTGDPAVTIIQANGDINTINFTANGLVNLGNVSNVKIDGGANGQYLKTDGIGNLTWDSIGNLSSNRAAPMPYLIPSGESYIVNENFQGLYSQAITIDGELEVDGLLIEVPISFAAEPTQILFADNGNPTGNSHFTFDKITGNVIVPGDFLPHANITQNLGSPTHRWNDIYLSNSTIYIGNSTISTDANTLVFTSGSGAFLEVAGNANVSILQNGNSNISIDTDANITFGVAGVPNVLVLTSNGLTFTGTLDVTGNIAPGGIKTDNYYYANGAPLDFQQPAGSNTQVQYNDNNNFGASSAFTFDSGNGTLRVAGNSNTGVGALNAGVTNTLLPNTIVSFSANVNSYTQVTLQNKSLSADATADFVVTADNGNDSTNYIDLGIINSGYDANTPTNSLGNIIAAGDGYLYSQGNTSNANQSGGNLAIGTTVPGKIVKIFAGGNDNTSIVANISNTGVSVKSNITTVSGAYYGNAAGLTNIPGGNVNGQVGNALLAGTVYTNAQPNITSVGTLTTLETSGNAIIGGNLFVNGNITYINVDTIQVEDPIIVIGGGPNGAPLTSNDGKDRGTLLQYYTSTPVSAFMGWDNSNSEFAFGSNVSEVNDLVTFNSLGNIRASTVLANVNGGTGTFSGNITAANANLGNVVSANYLVSSAGCVSIGGAVIAYGAGNAGIFNSLATDINIGFAANITMGSTTGNVTVRGNLVSNNISTTGNISANLITGTLTTASQANITTIGTLGNLSVTGNTVTNIANANTTLTQSIITKRSAIPATVLTVVDSFSTTDYRTAKYVVSSKNDDGFESVEVLLIHNDINSYITVYGAINDGGGNTVTFSTGINSGNVELRATGLAANTVINLLGTYVPN
jgi:hypothetical protein